MRRAGYTLIELLVVLGIISTVMGMAVGTWFSLANPSSIAATENFMRGVVLQARHASLSSRMPVSLHFDAENRTVGSHQQILLWQQSYDWATPAAVEPHVDMDGSPTIYFEFGATGYGFAFKPGPPEAYLKPEQLSQRLIRSKGDGFYMSCSFKVPSLTDIGIQNSSLQVPLLTVMRGSGTDVDGDDCIAGLELWALPQFTYLPTAIDPRSPDDDNTAPRGATWMPVGWVEDDGRPTPPMPDTLGILSWSLWNEQAYRDENFVRGWYDTYNIQTRSGDMHDQQQSLHTIRPDHWHDLALLYDGTTISLFLDGVVVDVIDAPASLDLTSDSDTDPEQVFALRGEFLPDQGNDRPEIDIAIDDAQIVRIGSIAPQGIPNGFEPVRSLITIGDTPTLSEIREQIDADPQDYQLTVRSGVVSLEPGSQLMLSNGTSALAFRIDPSGNIQTEVFE